VLVFPLMHLGYGWGFLTGLLRWSRHPRDRGRAAAANTVPLSR